MKIFVTGASGFIGSALVPELIGAGHSVVGLARSDDSAKTIALMGAEVHHGSLDDLDSLRAGAAVCDGIVHLAFNHDFTRYAQSNRHDVRVIETLGGALGDEGKPLVVASGILGFAPSHIVTEDDPLPTDMAQVEGTRMAGTLAALEMAKRGVRSSVVRLAPSVHDRAKTGFLAMMVDIARDKGASAYVGDGAQRWTAVHVLDAARVFRLTLENAPAGSILHGVAETAVPVRSLAEVIGEHLGVPVVSLSVDEAAEHFGFLAWPLGADAPASSALTQQMLDWHPTHAAVLDDLANGEYFDD